MAVVNRDNREWSWGTSILLKIGLLGISVMAVWWVGWPSPPIVQHDRVASVPVLEPVSARQLSLTLATGVSTIDEVQRSVIEREVKKLQLGDRSVLIDLNLGSRQELKSLPGIGEKLADRIMSYREIHGAFKRVNDVEKVSGIGKNRLQRLKPFVTVKAQMNQKAS